jgi:hypothetical protein
LAQLDDAVQLINFGAALRTARDVLQLFGIELIGLAECVTRQQFGIQVGHDVTSSSRVRRCSRARRA